MSSRENTNNTPTKLCEHSLKALVLAGDGVNCENETAMALKHSGFEAEIIHINELIQNPKILENFQLFALPGGFSFGDEIYSGKILSLKIKKFLFSEFKNFVNSGKAVIGICNGFQVLTCLNAFTDMDKEEQDFALIHNKQHEFLNRWVDLQSSKENQGPWTKMLPENFKLPIRHGEGNLLVSESLKDHFSKFQAISYHEDINGSYLQTAGITNKEGNVLGLMPHPEAALFKYLDPTENSNSSEKHWGSLFFDNIKNYLEGLSL